MSGSLNTLLSQPFPMLPSQFSNPGRQPKSEHDPAMHVDVALGKAQTLPQAEQLLGSLLMFTSQPLP